MNTNTDMQKQKKSRLIKQILKWAAIVAGVLMALAVIVGVCNAVFADGQWTFGWKNYRYDDSQYEIGGGTVPSDAITSIEIDWIDGIVQVIPCDDRYISLTEHTATALSDSTTVHWRVSEDGILSVKYRASAWFLGDGSEKNLTLRVPRTLFEQLQSIKLTSDSSDILLKGLQTATLSLETNSGDVRAIDCACESLQWITKSGNMTYESETCPNVAQIEFDKGNVTLAFPTSADFTLNWDGALISDLSITKETGRYICGDGSAQLTATSKSNGKITLLIYQPK